MSKPQTQHGYVFEGRNGKVFHIRFYAHENGKRKQRSAKLCPKDDLHSSKDAPAVLTLAESFMLKINQANTINDVAPGHNCPICGHRCKRTITGTFAKTV
jgi:hypothetical protein